MPVSFEVASVKPARVKALGTAGEKSASGEAAASFDVNHLTFTAQSVNLYALIVEAYGLKFCRPPADSCALLKTGSSWMTADLYDIQAKASVGSPEYTTMQLRTAQAPQLQGMLRSLLTERFHLRVRWEKQRLPVYAFTLTNSARLHGAAPDEMPSVILKPTSVREGPQSTQVVGTAATIQDLADLYAKFMDRPVVDSTGLNGRYDFAVEYEVDAAATGPFAAVTSPTLFQAFETQAGLKLTATRAPVSVLVVESATKPTPN